jgi:hypothetical protein
MGAFAGGLEVGLGLGTGAFTGGLEAGLGLDLGFAPVVGFPVAGVSGKINSVADGEVGSM